MSTIMGKHVYVTPRLLSNLLEIKLKGIKIRKTGHEKDLINPIDHEVPTDYRAGEFKATQRRKQAHELLTKVILSKTSSTRICSKFERALVYVITDRR